MARLEKGVAMAQNIIDGCCIINKNQHSIRRFIYGLSVKIRGVDFKA